MNFKNIKNAFIFLFFISFVTCKNAYAYLGPGLGIGSFLTVIVFLISILLAFLALLYYPIKIFIKKIFKSKNKKYPKNK